MRKQVILFNLSSLLFLLSSCASQIDESSNDDSSSKSSKQAVAEIIDLTEEKLQSVSYSTSSSPVVYEISTDVTSLNISGLSKGKNIWITKTNPTEVLVDADTSRYVTSVENLSTAEGNARVAKKEALPEKKPEGNHNECVSLNLNALFTPELSSERAVATPGSVSQITPVVNETTKEIYVDINETISEFSKEKATLRAVGKYCYVWVVGDTTDTKYWTESENLTAGKEQINSAVAQEFADNFDKIYPKVRRIFGEESSQIILSNTSLCDMNSVSDTGSMVNIVVYDLCADYGKNKAGGTAGYFYAKDYYYRQGDSTLSYSNVGKYFYIDAYFAANKKSFVISSLAHEFQHMIDFSVKTIATFTGKKLHSSIWYNEMKSMLCEDLMKTYLEENNADFTNDDSPIQRLPMFNKRYFETGLEYKTSDSYDVFFSYANNYAFGAWLARNYGGVSLISRMSSNSYVDIESITDAAGESMENLLKNYTVACLFQKSDYGFNKEVSQSEYECEGYSYPLDAIDLWNSATMLPESYSSFQRSSSANELYSYEGPVYFDYNDQQEIRPYGINLVKVGTAESSDVTLNFNMSGINTAQKIYVVVE